MKKLRLRSSGLAWLALGSLSALGSLVLAGCAEGDDRPPPLGLAQSDLCPAICATFERCGVGTSSASCVDDCSAGTRGYRRRITPAALDAESECLRAATACPEALDEQFLDCFLEAGQALESSEVAEQFCRDMSETFFECNWFPSPGRCAEEHSRFTPEALSAGARCRGKACDELDACIDSTLWTYGEP